MQPNSLAFIALCNEYCAAIEGAAEAERTEFVANMLRLLPRIYITATDLKPGLDKADTAEIEGDTYIENVLDEEYYESVRRSIEYLLGEDDTYLEVFEEDMKYSDTPIGASIAEGLADLFQVMYNFIDLVRDAPESLTASALEAMQEDFKTYWSRPLCNVLRALNSIKYFGREG